MGNRLKIWSVTLACLLLLCAAGAAAADTVTLPASLKTISAEMFAGDDSLDSVVVPRACTRIESRAFADSSLSVITLYDTVTYIAPDAFENCDVIACVTDGSYAASFCAEHSIPTRPATLYDFFRVYECEMADWWTSDADDVFYRRVKNTGVQCVATLYDISTGISLKVRRVGGDNHADVEPMTADDTEKICDMLGVIDPSEISSRKHYTRRPALLIVPEGAGYRLFAVSVYAVLHDGSRPSDENLLDNGLQEYGMGGYVMCVHFLNSKTSDTGKLDSAHQAAVRSAYNWWLSNFGD